MERKTNTKPRKNKINCFPKRRKKKGRKMKMWKRRNRRSERIPIPGIHLQKQQRRRGAHPQGMREGNICNDPGMGNRRKKIRRRLTEKNDDVQRTGEEYITMWSLNMGSKREI